MLNISDNLDSILGRIADACARVGRSPEEVTLVAVSKRQPDERLTAAYEAGHRDFGENFVQELVRKRALLPEDARWHLIGHLQTNKAKQAVGVAFIHTVDSRKVALAIDKAARARSLIQPVLIELNLAGEDSKAGLPPSALAELAAEVQAMGNLQLQGLMCIPPAGEGRPYFAQLRGLREELGGAAVLPHLSMGMSDDFEDAIAEGATLVRVGTAVFGPRS